MSEKNILQEYCQLNKLALPIYQSWSEGSAHQLQWSASATITNNHKDIIVSTIVPTSSKVSAEKQAARLMLDRIKSKNKPNHVKSRLEKLSEKMDEKMNDKNKNSLKLMSQDKIIKLKTKSIHESISDETINEIYDDPLILEDEINSDQSSKKGESEDESVNESVDVFKDKIFTSTVFDNIYLIDLENKPCFKHKFNKKSLYIGFINSIHHSVKKYSDWHECCNDQIEIKNTNKLLYLIEGGIPDLVDHFITMFIYPLIQFISNLKIKPIINIISGDHAGWCTRICLEKVLKWKNISGIEIKNIGNIN